MLDWYKVYDQETFMQSANAIDFRKFNPFYKLDKSSETFSHQEVASRPRCESIFDSSNAFSQMFYQFNLQLREQIKIRQIQDPFSEACLTYARQTCILLVNELM